MISVTVAALALIKGPAILALPFDGSENTIPACSNACLIVAKRFLCGDRLPASKSLIVELEQLARLARSSIDQFSRARPALHCSGNMATI